MYYHNRIGSHGEFLFQALITRICYNRFFFHPVHLGEKHPTIDFRVELFDPENVQSHFYVQVKSTTHGYIGKGDDRKLEIQLKRSEVEKLRRYPGPTYVAGMDIVGRRGYIVGIVAGLNGAINGLPARHPIDCRTIRTLWAEVDAYWNSNARAIPMAHSRFTI